MPQSVPPHFAPKRSNTHPTTTLAMRWAGGWSRLPIALEATTRRRPVATRDLTADIAGPPFTSSSWTNMFRTFGRFVVVPLVLVSTFSGGAAAQMQSMKDVQVADIETMKEKFIGLGQEFSESQYDWRPMEGVRSVKEVLALIVVEAHVFPTAWGFQPPAGAASGFGPETQRVAGFNKAQLLRELDSAFDHLIGVVRGMDEAK